MIRNVIVVSDLHCGCQLGLCPAEGVDLDDGGRYAPSRLQVRAWAWWQEFWGEWVPRVVRHEPFIAVVNGDLLDGVHHGATTPISANLRDQRKIALAVLAPVRDLCDGRLYIVRGTEVHAGKSGVDEETIAAELGAIPNITGQHARWDLWLRMGDQLVHCLHHIGTTASNAYEATAVGKELVEEFNEAARGRRQPPDCIIRSHRHRHIEVRVPTASGYGIACVTPGWQLKTPFLWRAAGSRLAEPQFGGVLVRLGDEELYTRSWVRSLAPTAEEVL